MQQPKILVAIRKRPLNKKQQTRGDSDIISVKKMQTVIVSQYKQKVDLTKYLEETVFNFDFAYDQNKNNQDIYQSAVRPLVDSAFQGAKVTCFAYGQTGSGKTYTMNGVPSQGIPGLYTLAAQDLFAYLQDQRFSHLKAKLCFFQIYCGKLFDLLNKRQQLKIREDNKSNINIIGLQEIEITSRQEFMDLLNYGASQRVTSQNSANLDSSRSHAILQIMIKDGKKTHGKMSFIDLAGNQRGADHMDMSKQTRIDGAQINKSLLSLKECIRALDQGKGHTPFRGSKLTMVLKDSFIGFCRTVMIGNVSPSSMSSQNTLNTLRYADRVKQLRKPSNSAGLTKEQQKAKQMMLPRTNKNVLKIDIDKDDDAQDIQLKRENAQRSYGIIENEHANNNGNIVLGNKRFQNNQIQNQQPMQVKQPNLSNNNAGRINMNGIVNIVNNGFNNQRKGNEYQLNKANQNQDYEQQIPGFNRNLSQDQYNSNIRQQPQIARGIPCTLNKANSMSYNQNVRSNQMEVQNSNYQGPKNGQPQMNNFIRQSNGINPTKYTNQINYLKKNSMEVQSPLRFKAKAPAIQTQQYTGIPQQNANIYTNKNLQPTSNNGNFSINFVGNSMPNKTFDIPPLFNNKSSESQNTTSVPQDFQIPNNWEQTVEMIFATEEPQRLLRLQESISENLLIEQTNLIQKHSNTLRRQIDTIKQEMALISKLQMDRNAIQTRDYVSFLQQSIEEKLSSLQLLRENLQQFTYKLDQVEQIEERVKDIVGQNNNQGGWDDEQLLDDLH